MIYDAFTPEVFTLTGGVMKSAPIFFEDLRGPPPIAISSFAAAGKKPASSGPRSSVSKEASETFLAEKIASCKSDLFFAFKNPQKSPKISK
jgi:hypothetical protein